MATTMTSLNIKVSVEEKDEFTRTAAALGMTPSAAIKVFVHLFNECGGFPFDVRRPKSDSSVTYLSASDYDRFARAIDEPVPQATQALLDREYSWAE